MEREAHSLGDIFYPSKACRRRQQALCIAEWTMEIILDDVVGRRPSEHEHIEICMCEKLRLALRDSLQVN